MAEDDTDPVETFHKDSCPQPLALEELLKAMKLSMHLSSLYGSDHPSVLEMTKSLARAVREVIDCFGPATLVFSRDMIVVNQKCYAPSLQSREFADRLRARGAVAVTFVDVPSEDQLLEFLKFLEAEPKKIREQGSPSTYLRQQGVFRIAVTEAVYERTEPGEAAGTDQSLPDSVAVDRAIAATIEWLSRQEDEECAECPVLPILQILSDPDSAAKLIIEAVTKLHASKRAGTHDDDKLDVLSSLKDLASMDPEGWDSSAPQVRKALTKLPREVRSLAGGLPASRNDSETPTKTVEMNELEQMIGEYYDQQSGLAPDLSPFQDLFGVAVRGLFSRWQEELRPDKLRSSSGTTLSVLLSQARNPADHIRIARAIKHEVLCAVDARDVATAVSLVQYLVNEANDNASDIWRSANAQTVLRSFEIEPLAYIVEAAFVSNDYRWLDVSARLVELMPSLALRFTNRLGLSGCRSFDEGLKRGIMAAGVDAGPALRATLTAAPTAASVTVLEMLVQSRSRWASDLILSILSDKNQEVAHLALRAIGSAGSTSLAPVCVEALGHPDLSIRCAAMQALGDLGDESAQPYLLRIIAPRWFGRKRPEELIAAIGALQKLGTEAAVPTLRRMAGGWSILSFGRNKAVGRVAAEAIDQITTRHTHSRLAA